MKRLTLPGNKSVCRLKLGQPKLSLGLDNPSIRRPQCAVKALLHRMVEEAYAYVQDASLKAYAALLIEAYQLPDHQSEGI